MTELGYIQRKTDNLAFKYRLHALFVQKCEKTAITLYGIGDTQFQKLP